MYVVAAAPATTTATADHRTLGDRINSDSERGRQGEEESGNDNKPQR